MGIDEDLIKQRAAAGLSQAELASALGLSQSQISRYEAEQDNIPLGLLRRWLALVGAQPQTGIVATPSPSTGVDPGRPFAEFWRNLDTIEHIASDAQRRIAGAAVDLDGLPSLDDLLVRLRMLRRKPNVLLAGRSDAGKSTLINSMLGQRLLPARYQPTTRLPTFVHHIEDLPSWAEAGETVFLARLDRAGDERSGPDTDDAASRPGAATSSASVWRRSRLVLGERSVMARGGPELLQRWSRDGGGEVDASASLALWVYADAAVLRACTIIDLPGFNSDDSRPDEDAQRAIAMATMADVLLYASSIQAFLSPVDLEYLALHLRALPVLEVPEQELLASDGPASLANVFIIATHAAPHVSVDQLETEILRPGTERLWLQFGTTLIAERGGNVSHPALRGRIFGFFDERRELRGPLHEALRRCVGEVLPAAVKAHASAEVEAVRQHATELLGAEIDALREMLADHDKSVRVQARTLRAEAVREAERRESARELLAAIDTASRQASSALAETWAMHATPNAVETLINTSFTGPQAQQQARKQAVPLVLERLRHAIVEDDRKRVAGLESKISAALKRYSLAPLPAGRDAAQRLLDVPFDDQGAFAGVIGLGVAALLGLAGGPALALAGVVWTLFATSWQARLSQSVVAELEKKRWREALEAQTKQLWVDRRERVEALLRDCEGALQARLRKRDNLLETAANERAQVEARVRALEVVRGVYLSLPMLRNDR